MKSTTTVSMDNKTIIKYKNNNKHGSELKILKNDLYSYIFYHNIPK